MSKDEEDYESVPGIDYMVVAVKIIISLSVALAVYASLILVLRHVDKVSEKHNIEHFSK